MVAGVCVRKLSGKTGGGLTRGINTTHKSGSECYFDRKHLWRVHSHGMLIASLVILRMPPCYFQCRRVETKLFKEVPLVLLCNKMGKSMCLCCGRERNVLVKVMTLSLLARYLALRTFVLF